MVDTPFVVPSLSLFPSYLLSFPISLLTLSLSHSPPFSLPHLQGPYLRSARIFNFNLSSLTKPTPEVESWNRYEDGEVGERVVLPNF